MEFYTLSLHDALPILVRELAGGELCRAPREMPTVRRAVRSAFPSEHEDRKSTRLNSSHVAISYAVFCLKKKTTATSGPRATPPPVSPSPTPGWAHASSSAVPRSPYRGRLPSPSSRRSSHSSSFHFLTRRRPWSSTLFPYTTLFRSWYENLPVVSYVVLRGKCRSCGAPYDRHFPRST